MIGSVSKEMKGHAQRYERRDPAGNQRPREPGAGQLGKPREIMVAHDFQGRPVRAVVRGGRHWFVAADVCTVLEHTNHNVAISRLDEDERGLSNVYTPGGPRTLGVINESGLYALILTSRTPQAKTFRRWVTAEVLPSPRRTAAREVATDLPGHVALSLKAPGRCTVTLTLGQPAHIQRMPLHSVSRDLKTSDIEILALALRMTGSWWRRVQHLTSSG